VDPARGAEAPLAGMGSGQRSGRRASAAAPARRWRS